MSLINNLKDLLTQSKVDREGNLIVAPDLLKIIQDSVSQFEQQADTKKIDFGVGSFVANGTRYYIEESLSIDRYIKYEQIEVALGFGRAFTEVYDQIRGSMDDINNHKQGEAYIKLYNIMNGVQHSGQKKPHVFRFCALFMNAENEDRKIITDDMINRKIEDWRLEGLDYQPFFEFAITSLPGFIERYRRLIQSTSL